jgi:enolase-phosphatase E1
VTFRLREHNIRSVVVDIEGTTTPVSYVYDVLFPYARKALPAYVAQHLDAPELRATWDRIRDDWMQDVARGESPPAWSDDDRHQQVASIVTYAEWLMDRDRKAPGLKALQGHIWKRGYGEGILSGEVFDDVPDAFARWRSAGMNIAIFSSGSTLAQQMLFRTTAFGDLTPWIDAYFDTSVGPKISPESYRRIADALHCPAGALLFVSDTSGELEAARAAGCAALMCVRPGQNQPREKRWETISSFSAVD